MLPAGVKKQANATNKDAARMSQCQRSSVPDETYRVEVLFPLPTQSYCKSFFCFFLILVLVFLVFGLYWVVAYCQDQPGMALETLSIRNMTAYQTNATGGTPWQVDSAFNIGLSTWNPNTVAGCFTTFRRVLVRVEYRGQTILRQEELLGFGLRPRRSRAVMMKVEEEGFLLKKPDLGPVMEEEIGSGNVMLDVFFSARYVRNDQKAGWVGLDCVVAATLPSNSSSSSAKIRCY